MSTVDELREEIRDLLDIPDYARGASSLRTGALTQAGEALELDYVPGSGPMARDAIRLELDILEPGSKKFQKDELRELRDALQEEMGDG